MTNKMSYQLHKKDKKKVVNKRRVYTEDDLNTVRYLARYGASAKFIAMRIGVARSTILTNQYLKDIYKKNKTAALKDFMKEYYTRACSGKNPAIMIHYAKTQGLNVQDFTDIDLSKYETYEEKCEALDKSLAAHDISVQVYNYLSNVISKRFDNLKLEEAEKRIEELEKKLNLRTK